MRVLNNDVLSPFDAHDAKVEVVLRDNGRAFCSRGRQRPYELLLQLPSIEHKRTQVGRPQWLGIVERLHRTALEENCREADRGN